MTAKSDLYFSPVLLLLSCRLYYFSLHDDYCPFVYTIFVLYFVHIIYSQSSATIFDKLKWEAE